MTNQPDLVPPALALEGAAPEITSAPTPASRWRQGEESRFLQAMLEQPSLFYWKGPQTERLVDRFRAHYPFTEIMPCSSGTAALHIAVAAAGIAPGDEVIVPPITDMGSVIGILYQQGVPVFADLDPHTYNLSPTSVREKITAKTRAIIAVHLAGNPCAMDELNAIAEEHNLILIEDCAQAWGTKYRGKQVGLFSHFGCYSFNDFKHLSCGDGGIVASSDPRFAPRLQRFGDKGYDRHAGTRAPEFLAPNYRISEPQSAIAAAQMNRLEAITNRRAFLGSRLTALLEGTPGISLHRVDEEAHCTFWFYLLRLNGELRCDRALFAKALQAEGVQAGAGYIAMPLYRYPLFQNHHFFGGRWPIRELGLTSMDYRDVCTPVAEEILATSVSIRINEQMSDDYLEGVARAIRKIARYYH